MFTGIHDIMLCMLLLGMHCCALHFVQELVKQITMSFVPVEEFTSTTPVPLASTTISFVTPARYISPVPDDSTCAEPRLPFRPPCAQAMNSDQHDGAATDADRELHHQCMCALVASLQGDLTLLSLNQCG